MWERRHVREGWFLACITPVSPLAFPPSHVCSLDTGMDIVSIMIHYYIICLRASIFDILLYCSFSSFAWDHQNSIRLAIHCVSTPSPLPRAANNAVCSAYSQLPGWDIVAANVKLKPYVWDNQNILVKPKINSHITCGQLWWLIWNCSCCSIQYY